MTAIPTAARSCAAILVSLFFIALPVPASSDEPVFGSCNLKINAPRPVTDALDEVLRQIRESVFGSAPGGVLSVRSAQWRYARSIGVADPGAGTPIDCEMPFQIGSNTKMMTAVILLQLQEEGRLSLDDPLAKYLPDVAARLPFGESMTLRQLARHTSGVFSYTDNAPDGTPGLMEGAINDAVALKRELTPREMIDFVVEHGEPTFPPGKKGAWHYSNTGYALLGMVIEKLEKLAFDKSLETRIFGPLGMKNTYLWNDIPRPSFGLPRSYLAAPFDFETTAWNMSQGWAAGAVISTIDDMHTFIEALVAGKLFRSPETLTIMQDTVPTSNPALQGYGIGLALKGDKLWGHGGQTLGFESDIAAFADLNISLVAWGTSSSNVLVLGASVIAKALRDSGALGE